MRTRPSIIKFSNESPVPISYGQKVLKNKSDYFFDKSENILLSNIIFWNSDFAYVSSNFRGQPFSDFNDARLHCLQVTADFYGYVAKDFLTYNREKILPDAKSKASKSLTQAVLNYIDANFDNIPEEQKPYAAAFYFFNKKIDTDKMPKFILNSLELFEVYIDDLPPITLGEIIKKIKNNEIPYLCSTSSSVPTEKNVINKAADRIAFDLIKYMTTKDGLFYTKENSPLDQHGYRYIWSTTDVQPVSNQILKSILFQKERSFEVGCRCLFPCWSQYRNLAVIVKVSWPRIYHYQSASNDIMVLPCFFNSEHGKIVEFDDSEELSLWIYNNRKRPEVDFETIKNLHLELVSELKKIALEEKLDSTKQDIVILNYKYISKKVNLLLIK